MNPYYKRFNRGRVMLTSLPNMLMKHENRPHRDDVTSVIFAQNMNNAYAWWALPVSTIKHFQSLCQLFISLNRDVSPRRSAVKRPAPRRTQKLNDVAIAELCRLYLDGASTYDLARLFGIRRDQVAIQLRRAGVEVRPGHQSKLNAYSIARARELKERGWSVRRIARELGVTDNTAAKALRN